MSEVVDEARRYIAAYETHVLSDTGEKTMRFARALVAARNEGFEAAKAIIAAECDASFKDGEWNPWASRAARSIAECVRSLKDKP